MNARSIGLLLTLPALALSSACWADTGLPMLVLVWPSYILALIPVIVIEAYVGVRKLGLSWRVALRICTVGNLWSTLLGVPMVWLLLLGVEMPVGVAAYSLKADAGWQYLLFPFPIAWVGGESVWIVYAAFVLLAFPFCAASIWIERKVALRYLPDLPAERVRSWVRDANIWSYVLLVAVAIAYPIAFGNDAT